MLNSLLSACIATVVGVCLVLTTRNQQKIRAYAAVAISCYIAVEFGFWWFLIWPGLVALVFAVAGGLVAGYYANEEINALGHRPANVTMLMIFAISLTSAFVVFSFYLSIITWSDPGNMLLFTVVVGGVPPVVAAVVAHIGRRICHHGSPVGFS